jgi:uncharacterized protein (TIGR02757 family)
MRPLLPARRLAREVAGRYSASVAGLSSRRAAQLSPLLERFFAQTRWHERVGYDPVEFPRRYRDPRDIEVSALLSAGLAYGRADLFRPRLQALHRAMGPSPAAFVRQLDVPGARTLLDGFVYRFNVATDVAVLLLGMGRVLRELGSLEAPFAEGMVRGDGGVRAGLAALTTELRRVPMAGLRRALGPERGLEHLVPQKQGPGAAKRLNLFLRWVVRGPDQVDLGIWKRVPPSALVIPLDTHVMRMARNLGLTRRKDVSWRTAEEVTASLRLLDPDDPVRFDFALCHYGMSGACPAQPLAANCARCTLLQTCTVGPRVLRRAAKARG